MKKVLLCLILISSFCFALTSEERQEMDQQCLDGDANVCYALAKMSERSGSLMQNKNTPESRKYYKKAAQLYQNECEVNNNITSCSIIGNMYFGGQGVGKDPFKAKEYYDKSCKAGDQDGCVGLGGLHVNGISARKDPIKAKEYFEKACEEGNPNGCLLLAHMYKDGRQGIGKSKSKAKEFFGKACDNNSPVGCAEYNMMSK